MTPSFWKGKRVLVTGHTGFKGGWLSVILNLLGIEFSQQKIIFGETFDLIYIMQLVLILVVNSIPVAILDIS